MDMKKKKILLGTASLVLVALLAACGSSDKKDTSSVDNSKPLKMWVDKNQGTTYRKLAKAFEKKEKIKVQVVEVPDADEAVLKDPDSAADVIRLPSDQLGKLVDAGSVYENEKYADQVNKESIPTGVAAATYRDKLYGYPASIDAMVIYYDKRVFKESDFGSLDAMLKKGKVGLKISDYNITPWFIANGSQLYGKSGEDLKGTTLNNAKGLDVLKWVAKAKSIPNLVVVDDDDISAMQEGKVSALFGGVWNAPTIKKILGKNMGTAVYPKADLGDGQISLKSFSGVPMMVVNSATKNPLKAMDLARFMTTGKAQLQVFDTLGTVPINAKARENEKIKSDELANTIAKMTTEEHSILMPQLPQMKNFWPNMNALLVDTYKGKVSEAQMQQKLDKLVKDVSKSEE